MHAALLHTGIAVQIATQAAALVSAFSCPHVVWCSSPWLR